MGKDEEERLPLLSRRDVRESTGWSNARHYSPKSIDIYLHALLSFNGFVISRGCHRLQAIVLRIWRHTVWTSSKKTENLYLLEGVTMYPALPKLHRLSA
jgi:hypothetical protein